MTTPDDLVERVARVVRDGFTDQPLTPENIARAAIAIALEEAARVAEREGVYPELNVYNGGPEWYRHGRDIAAAIRAMIKDE
jgi:hypothetical protein